MFDHFIAEHYQLVITIIEWIIICLFGMAGGWVQALLQPKQPTAREIFIIGAISAFVGIVVYLIVTVTAIPKNIALALVGISGTSSKQILRLLQKWTITTIKKRGDNNERDD